MTAAILAIDPGPVQSGWALYGDGRVIASGTRSNHALLVDLRHDEPTANLAIEMIASYGMPVGREVFETVWWIGRFTQAWPRPEEVRLIYRRDVKLELCGSARAKDANVRAALIDRVGKPGTKKQPGPTYGVKGDAWSALAVAVTATAQARAAA